MHVDVFAIRHGETAWSRAGRHTGRTDIPLTEAGRAAAIALGTVLARSDIARVLSSPLQRARETCTYAGLGNRVELDADLVEWDYGDFEGLTPAEIDERAPGWLIFADGCPGGEQPADVEVRVDRAIAKLRGMSGCVAVFGHGHLLRALAARWIGLPLVGGSHFLLNTSTLSLLGYYRDTPAIKRWNVSVEGERHD